MKTTLYRCCMLLCASLLLSTAWAATTPALDPKLGRVEDREALRVLLGAMEKAISDVDVEAALKLMHPQAIVTWQNAEVSRGHDEIRAYHAKMVKGTAPIVKKFGTKATLGGPAVFYADSAVAYGTNVDTYELTEGLQFILNANWSSTSRRTSSGTTSCPIACAVLTDRSPRSASWRSTRRTRRARSRSRSAASRPRRPR